MNHILRRSTTIIAAAVIAVVALIFILVGGLTRVAADDEPQAGRLITIYDRGEEKVLLSDAETVAGALEDAQVAVAPQDAVEPALDAKLVATEYHINVYRARPVTVVDGPTKQRIVTPYQTAEQIVKDAGIELNPEDLTKLSRSDDLLADGAGLQLAIDRALPLTVDLFGTKTDIRTQGETVGEMLRQKNIELESDDRASVPLDTPVTAGMSVRVWREGKQTLTVEESVDFKVEQIRDADREFGYREIQKVGKKGERSVTYEIEIKDGKVVKREEIASITTKAPVKQVEIIGIKVQLLANYSADKAAIMSAAGVSPDDQPFAAYIINNENALWCPIRWQGTVACWAEYAEKFPGAETSNQVGYGLCQATPGIKMATAGSDWRTNAVTQMKWCHNYALGRYGSWQAAYEFKRIRGWW